MRVFSAQSPSPKIIEKRRGVRFNSRVPIVLEWQDDSTGRPRNERAFTRVIGPYGCLVILPWEFALDQRLRVVNLANEQANDGVIVWKSNPQTEGWEVGIELTQPPMDFWGFEL